MREKTWRIYMDHEKEEAWLNEMSSKGLAFTDFILGRYTFSDSEPGEYTYRIELLDNPPTNIDSRHYLGFMAENGVEHVASWGRWVYFRKRTEEGPFNIYSDIDSRIQHYRRIGTLWFVFMCVYLVFSAWWLSFGVESIVNGQLGMLFYKIPVFAIFLFLFVAFFYRWNSLRRRVTKLKLEQQLRE
jgi:hypothetical protein